ncbi:Glycosyltransferase [Prochlorococcus marinus subsp. marinus str. CCMP1375]|uniref:Glycosyltransferase n=1 Tax=Prochlorococcus marinus (strain SARG / CCMP1375 / SS120) TaxID=167539 RepID=Q7VCQ8_PROMA|nr:glycosyltransferase family 4 protein [Prochlorococcus marinus]AAP99726.1 Glycosyltransferase [Prochlorococcus marinus subsp. marinus str. CCMP1375]
MNRKVKKLFLSKQPSRINLIVTRSDTVGGVHTHILNLIKTLESFNCSVHVITGNSKKALFIKRLDKLSIKYTINPYLVHPISIFNDVLAILWLTIFTIRSPKSILWSHSSKAGIISRIAAFISMTPSIHTVHGWSFVAPKRKLTKTIYLILERILSVITKKFIVVSEFDYNLALKKGFPYRKIDLIHNSVDRKSYRNRAINAKDSKVRFIMVARFDKQKDHLTVLNAFSLLSHYDNWELYFIGDGPLYEKIYQYASTLNIADKIIFGGHVSNVEKYYSLCNVFILSSHWEGFPMTSIEAMSYSLPLIISDVGGSKEVVIDDYNGYIFNSKDYQTLSKYISKFLEDPNICISMGKASLRIFENAFSDRIASDKIKLTLESVLN